VSTFPKFQEYAEQYAGALRRKGEQVAAAPRACLDCLGPINLVGAAYKNYSRCYRCWKVSRGAKITLPGASSADRLAAFGERLRKQLAEAQTPQARKALEDKLRALGQEVGGKSPLKTSG
jgi:hypothetical protein